MWREESLSRKSRVNVTLHIGLDDIDSPRGGCTTHITAILVERLLKKWKINFLDYPNLIRLNPNIPWKTRGNGATALRLQVPGDIIDEVIEFAYSAVEEYVGLYRYPSSQPAVAFYIGGHVPEKLRWFSRKTIRDVIVLDLAFSLAEKLNITVRNIRGRRGIVGALAAIGEPLDRSDYTFELIAYRLPENYGKPRRIDEESVLEMDKRFSEETFLNVDYEAGRILITPRGPDPVLLGVRGESAEAVLQAFKLIRVYETVERWIIFRTNQATDAHLMKISRIADAKPYLSIIVEGKVSKEPRIISGGHVIFSIADSSGEIDCAAYQPTGSFRNIVKQLTLGDYVKVYGGVRPASLKHGLTINLEKIEILKLTTIVSYRNPKCPKCNHTMKSAGKNKGYKCPKCGYKTKTATKTSIIKPRKIKPGLYTPPPRAYRHLTKPPKRKGKEKQKPPKNMITTWHQP